MKNYKRKIKHTYILLTMIYLIENSEELRRKWETNYKLYHNKGKILAENISEK
jgi:hypothetical protein